MAKYKPDFMYTDISRKELCNYQNVSIISMNGVGSKEFISNQKSFGPDFTHDIVDYDSGGIIGDVRKLINDIKLVAKKDINTIKKTSIEDRLTNLVRTIKKEVQDPYNRIVVLLGFSHGSLIMFRALAMVEADVTVSHEDLQKLCFYAVSPPTILPSNILKYSSAPQPFLQLHFEKDFFYRKKTAPVDSLPIKCILCIAKALVVNTISDYFDEFIKFKSESEAKKEKLAKFYYLDDAKKLIMEIEMEKPPHAKDAKDACDLSNSKINIHLLDSFELACLDLRGNQIHAIPTMLYPIMNIEKVFKGGCSDFDFILGKHRKIIRKGRWQYVKYNNKLITLEAAKKMQKLISSKKYSS